MEDKELQEIVEKQDSFARRWIDKQFEIAGYDLKMNDVLGIDDWFQQYTITEQQEEELREWSMTELKELYSEWTDKYREIQYSTLVLNWGLMLRKENNVTDTE